MSDTFLSAIPFQGFYYSVHDSELDRALEYLMENRYCGPDIPQSLANKIWDSVDWAAAHESYAKEYAESFLQWLGLDGEFESMDSPREYNFTTDRVFVKLTRADLARLWHMTPREVLTHAAEERFTSYDGFRPFYPSDWRSWGRLSDWDHNQIGTLVAAAAAVEHGGTDSPDWDGWAELALMEDAMCNGGPEEWITQGETIQRWLKVWDWLQERCQRPRYTMADAIKRLRAANKPFGETPLGRAAQY